MAQKKELSEQEKVSLILEKAGVVYDPLKAQSQIALNTRCRRCGRSLSSLERVVFEDRCLSCIEAETKKKRDSYVLKYIIIAFSFVLSLIIGVVCSQKDASKGLLITGTVISSVVTGISLVYVFYTNIDKMFPRVPIKAQIWCCFTLAALIDLVLCLMIILFSSWILYFLLMLAVGAYLAYIAYGEYYNITEKYNLIEVYNRKSRDSEFIESITEALETRAATNEEEEVEEKSETEEVAEGETIPEEAPPVVSAADLFEIIKKKEKLLNKKSKTTTKSEDFDNTVEDVKKDTLEPTQSSDAAEESEDSGEFFI